MSEQVLCKHLLSQFTPPTQAYASKAFGNRGSLKRLISQMTLIVL